MLCARWAAWLGCCGACWRPNHSAARLLKAAPPLFPCRPQPSTACCWQEAFSQLARFPQARLEARLSLADWQTVLDAGLAGPLPSGAGAGAMAAAAKHAATIRVTAQALLLRRLGLADGGEDEEEGEEEAEDGGTLVQASDGEDEWLPAAAAAGVRQLRAGGAGAGSTAAWMARLEALRALPPHAEACATAAHLRAAWREALVAALEPQQLALLGEGEPGGGGAAEAVEDGEGGGGGVEEEDEMWD